MMGTPAIEKDRMAVRRIIAKALAVGGYREHDLFHSGLSARCAPYDSR